MATPAITSKNPKPYPKDSPATHIDGEVGKRMTGKSAMEANIRNASTGASRFRISHFINGITTYKN